MRGRCAVAVVAAIGFVVTTPSVPRAAAAVASVTLTSCREQNGIFPVAAPLVQHDVPPGFALDTSGLGPLVGAILLDGFSCLDAGHRVSAMFAFLAVIPPAKYQIPGSTGYLLMLDGWVDDPGLAATFSSWGFGPTVRQAPVRFTSTALPTGPLGTVTEGDSQAGVQLTSVGFGPITSYAAAGLVGSWSSRAPRCTRST
jgi:hypothetical protein